MNSLNSSPLSDKELSEDQKIIKAKLADELARFPSLPETSLSDDYTNIMIARGFLFLSFLIIVVFSFMTAFKEKPLKPNIVFISIDDLNDWVGFLGHKEVTTPNMNNLAKDGYSFTNAHCPAPVCGPSRTAIFSGLQPVTSGAVSYTHLTLPTIYSV